VSARSTTIRDRDRRQIARLKPPCHICEQPIDYSLKSPDPMSFEVDHVLALHNGGTDTLDNKAASHRQCNREKWHRLAEELGPRQFVTHRVW
jgi:5-methylcytosine-specific restriction endonuclease McrA